ncbi:hypothetical protein C3L33_19745, partial [Rhododendron williamsianum]
MEEDSRPAPPDLAEAEACGNELTRTDSGSSSVTVDISKDFVRTKNVARPETPVISPGLLGNGAAKEGGN